MIALFAGLVAVGIALPRLLRLDRAPPGLAIVIWASSLATRALAALCAVAALILLLPRTDVFITLTHWCWHVLAPFMGTTTPLDGHRVGDAVVSLPGLLVLGSLLSVTWGIVQSLRSVHGLIALGSLGDGPQGALIVGGSEVVLAAIGVRRPRVIVSVGALTALDDEELAAGLAHERAHLEHRHLAVLVFAELCRGPARFLPGTRRAVDQLRFHMERDADQWAISHRHDRLALASAICKAATGRSGAPTGLAQLGATGVRERLEQLLEAEHAPSARSVSRALRAVALGMILGVLVAAALAPATAVAAAERLGPRDATEHCHR